MIDLGSEVLSAAAYGLVGIALMTVGYLAVDLLTPGRLGDLVYAERNRNAAILVASGALAIGTIVTTAILTSESEDGLGAGLLSAGVYGLLGVVLLSVSFVVVDLLTPGKLGELVTHPEPHPAVYVTAATHVAVGAIVAAAIS